MKEILAVLVLCAASTGPVSAQTVATAAAPGNARGTATIAGVVTTDDAMPRPLRRALVSLSGGARTLQVVTDDAGRYEWSGLPSGRYTVMAEKPGYVRAYYGSKAIGRGPGLPIAVAEGDCATANLKLLPGAVLTGAVTDRDGVPLGSAQVTPLVVTVVNGARKLVPPVVAGRWTTTDDRGAYRLYGLPPGQYVIQASAGLFSGGPAGVRLTTASDVELSLRELQSGGVGAASRQTTATPAAEAPGISRSTVYFPAATDPEVAEVVSLRAGEERTGLDLRVPYVRVAKIEGTVAGPQGQTLRSISVGIANLSTGSLWGSLGSVQVNSEGRFVVPPLPPGRYLLFGRGSETPAGNVNPATLPLWTETEVTLDEQDVSGVVMRFAPASRVSGRILVQGGGVLPPLPNMRIGLRAVPTIAGAESSPAAVPVSPDGSFVIDAVPPGKYRLTTSGSGMLAPRSAVLGGRDTLDAPVEVASGEDVNGLVVTMTDRPARIMGTLFDQLGRPSPQFAVVVFSSRREDWTTAPRRMSGLVKVGSDGKFSVNNLPPGEYFLVAVTDAEPAQLANPSFLDELVPGAIRITLGENEQHVQDLKLGGIGSGP